MIPKRHGKDGQYEVTVPAVADRVAQTVVAMALEPEGRADLPPGLLRLPAGAVRAGCGGDVPPAVLEEGLGDRSGHPEVLRQRAVGPDGQGGRGEHRPAGGWCCMCGGGLPRRCCCPTARWRCGTGEPRKVQRFHPCSRICSCTTRSTSGWRGSSRASRSNATWTTRSCTARQAQALRCWPPAGADGGGRAGAAPGQDQDRVLQGQQPAWLVRAHVVHVPGVRVPARRRRRADGKMFTGFHPAISTDALKKMGQQVRQWRIHTWTGTT